MKRAIFKYTVELSLPPDLQPLLEMAYNLWWTWNPRAAQLFERVDPKVWEKTHHNPVQMLGYISLNRFHELIADKDYMDDLREIFAAFQRYMSHPTWCQRAHMQAREMMVAYFSAEYGLHESLPIYSGGLGILSGDHLKSASDLGAPLVGVGLFYRHGYFRQYLNPDGWQMQSYPANDFFNLPAQVVKDAKDRALMISVKLPGREVFARIWKIQVGRVPLYLLDSDIDRNSAHDREITSYLYGGGLETRIEQEILLGIGGVRALEALGLRPSMYHINEGHSAFLGLERIRAFMAEEQLPYEVALELVRQTNLFTTHTPVPAGIDKFPEDMVRGYLGPFAEEARLPIERILELGKEQPQNMGEPFNMAVLALRLSTFANGVSELHGTVSRRMWRNLWPDIPESEIPIQHVTNGIHTQSWFSTEIAALYDTYLGQNWLDDPVNPAIWEKVDEIPEDELWACRMKLKRRLVEFARQQLREQLISRGAQAQEVIEADDVLDPEALTIGFARRFATYKRATLLFRDIERLKRILTNSQRPVQFVFAGKAHPNDNHGKELIRQIVQISRLPEFKRRIVFLQDYNIQVARYILQGVDVWLNTPRRPLEASGTSGMKGPVSGVINFSILDGWWCEAYNGANGWAIGGGEEYSDHAYQDTVEGEALYDTLEQDIAPLYYDRDGYGLPRRWIERMKASIRTVCPRFNTNRMVEEYIEKFYLPAFLQWRLLSENQFAEARSFCEWAAKIEREWPEVLIQSVEANMANGMRIGDKLPVRVTVALGGLSHEDIEVEICHGRLEEKGELTDIHIVDLEFKETIAGAAVYEGILPCETTGQRGFMARVLPSRVGMPHPFHLRKIKWWDGWAG